MRTELKAALAGTAGVVLLAGGGGTLAYWTDQGTTGGATVTSGTLTMSDPDCDPSTAVGAVGSVWTLNGATPFDPATGRIVPGDTLVKVCTFTISATGANLTADLAATGGGETGDLAASVATTASFLVDGQAVTSVDSSDDGATVTATITVDFPFGTVADNTSQDKGVTIADHTVTLTQTDASV